MRLRVRVWLVIAAINGALAVALGAFAAHGLAGRLDAHALDIFETGARYHMYHALALGLASLAMRGAATRMANWSAWFFLAGIVLFSGSLYLLALTSMRVVRLRDAVRRRVVPCGLGISCACRCKDKAMSGEHILVAGSGIAGLGAALAFGDGKRRVTLIDRDPPPPDGDAEEPFRTGSGAARRSFATAMSFSDV